MEGYDVLHVVGFISLKQSCHWSILNLNNLHTNAIFSTFPAQNAISIVKTVHQAVRLIASDASHISLAILPLLVSLTAIHI